MTDLAPDLLLKINDSPESLLDVIVRVEGDLDTCEAQLTQFGFEIRRRLVLISGFAATGPGYRVQDLTIEPWVISIEQDQQVQAL